VQLGKHFRLFVSRDAATGKRTRLVSWFLPGNKNAALVIASDRVAATPSLTPQGSDLISAAAILF